MYMYVTEAIHVHVWDDPFMAICSSGLVVKG